VSVWTAILSVLLAFAVNECCDVSPWAAKKILRWSARLRYCDPERAEIRDEELVALIEDMPGKLFKLITALCFAAAALVPCQNSPIAADRQLFAGYAALWYSLIRPLTTRRRSIWAVISTAWPGWRSGRSCCNP
jgi:hypothetical protein